MTRNRGPREGEACGSWVATYQRAAPSVGPRYTCTRRYHPHDDLHYTSDRTRWWLTGDKWSHRTGYAVPSGLTRHRAVADAMKVGPAVAALVAANTSERANPDTTDTGAELARRLAKVRTIRAELDKALAAGDEIRLRITALQRALAAVDNRLPGRTEPR